MRSNDKPWGLADAAAQHISRCGGEARRIWQQSNVERYEDMNPAQPLALDRRSVRGALMTITRAAVDLIHKDCSMLTLTLADMTRARVTWTEEARNLRAAMLIDLCDVLEEFPTHKFSPFVHCFMEWRFGSVGGLYQGSAQERPVDHQIALLRLLNQEVAQLRSALRDPELRHEQRMFQRNAVEKFRDLLRRVEDLRSVHPQVLGLRFDLHLDQRVHQRQGAGEDEKQAQLQEFVALRAKFHDAMEYILGERFVGYSWSLEYGRLRGFHVHYWVHVLPLKRPDDLVILNLLEAKWITAAGLYAWVHNCNADPTKYWNRIVGRTDLRDARTIRGIRRWAAYQVLTDAFAKPQLPLNVRTFGMGKFPRFLPCAAGSLPPIQISVAEAESEGFLDFV